MAVNSAASVREADPDANPVRPNGFYPNGDGTSQVVINGFGFGRYGGQSSNDGSALSSGGDIYDQIARITAQNNTWSARQAERQMDYQTQANKIAMDYNSAEAAKNRSWQEYMSNTAHQREVKDLRAAGLNPILSASGGNGAAVTSGATASGVTSSGARGDTDMSGSHSLVTYLASMLQANTQLQAMQTSALTNLAVADKYTSMDQLTTQMRNQSSERIAQLDASTRLQQSEIQAMASKFAAITGADASKVVAALYTASNQTVAKLNNDASYRNLNAQLRNQRYLAAYNAAANKELAQMGIDADFELKSYYPTLNQVWGDMLNSIWESMLQGGINSKSNFSEYFK
ncbi:DNA pilot protein [Sigmofec virus UA08Rod_5594]|uniref:DNA pilot protein n=1 Tax=Sigmofec virus UA08Rod_5594 TaxID=2929430 RepID=A0A976N1K5_9VIRU|nr:DNA pilot protein [Sigmofec virus UA08Rod_5594]